MVPWAWIPISLMIGVILGFFLLAFMEVTREETEKRRGDEKRE